MSDNKALDAVEKMLRTPLNFDPHVIDAGDGIEWKFVADPSPTQTEELRLAFNVLQEKLESGAGLKDAYDHLGKVISTWLIKGSNKQTFPRPNYGVNALLWFAFKLQLGRDPEFPTQ